VGQLQQQTFNMEQASMTTENLRNTMATVDAMKTANKEMKKQYGKLDIDKIEVSPAFFPLHAVCDEAWAIER
jgi:charged multivesicular body protein 5